jgi:transposase
MMGQKEKDFKQHSALCLEDLVPQDNFYREVETKLDISFVRELVKDKYCWWNGRSSIDPVVFFKLQLIMFFEGIRSERQLMVMAPMRLDHLWYIGYDFNEPVPDHSSLSDIRLSVPNFMKFLCGHGGRVRRCLSIVLMPKYAMLVL